MLELASEVAKAQNLSKKAIKAKILQGAKIRIWLKALNYSQYLSKEQRDRIIYCLIKIADLNEYPVAPILNSPSRPDFIIGIPGPAGPRGPRGEDGGGTDFGNPITVSTGVIDQFPIGNARAARWDYVIYSTLGVDQRQGQVLAGWSADGSQIKRYHHASLSIGADTSDAVRLSVDYFGGNIRLIATITSGTWTIKGSRYFIPNNGTGTGPINANLPFGQIFIGNGSNVAEAQSVSGEVLLSPTGVTTIQAGIITNAHINGSANIDLNKLASLTPSRVVITNGSGKLITGSVTDIEIGYSSGLTGNIQVQLNGKIGSVTGAISPYVSVDAIPSRVVVSDPSGKFTVSGVTVAELGNLSGTTGPIQAQLDAAVQAVGVPVNIISIDIGSWNMAASATKSITLVGLPFAKLGAVTGHVVDDASSLKVVVNEYHSSLPLIAPAPEIGIASITPSGSDTVILLRRLAGSSFDSPFYSSTGVNRGRLYITYDV